MIKSEKDSRVVLLVLEVLVVQPLQVVLVLLLLHHQFLCQSTCVCEYIRGGGVGGGGGGVRER